MTQKPSQTDFDERLEFREKLIILPFDISHYELDHDFGASLHPLCNFVFSPPLCLGGESGFFVF
ncbi:MAG: hypothetical protein DWI02_12450 [Planctomycetota bacterium]|nr:MAG: hypothetical protein DWI02_12450 [Planctomycetota bacterium]